MILIKGMGWITQTRYGAVLRHRQFACPGPDKVHAHMREAAVFRYPVKNFNRFDTASQMTCCAAALALHDGGVVYDRGQKQAMGIYGAGESGCLRANTAYFTDYVTCGRTLARGNLFIYTLPSSPLSEAAIHLGCQGPLLHLTFPDRQAARLLGHAEAAIAADEAPVMLAVLVYDTAALCFYLGVRRGPDETSVGIESIVSAIGKSPDIHETIRRLAA